MLERLLAIHPRIIGCGEVHNFLNDFKIIEVCSCGKSVNDCLVWRDAYNEFNKNKKKIDSFSIFKLLSKNTDQHINYLSDTSKTTFGNMLRPYLLSKKYDVYVIHLVRKGQDCLNSILKRRDESNHVFKKYLKILSTAIHWSTANIVASLFQFYFTGKYRKIKYEELVNDPTKCLDSLYSFLDLDSKIVIEYLKGNKQEIPLTHQLSGNAIRNKKDLIMTKNSTQNITSPLQRSIFQLVAWPVLKKAWLLKQAFIQFS